jgi:hypothetical protein
MFKCGVVLVSMGIVVKCLIGLLLVKYRNINQSLKKKINIYQFVFILYGKKDPHNLLVKVIGYAS